MDAERFDRLTRSLHDPHSRRGALASVLGGVLGLLGLEGTEARKRHKHHKHRKHQKPPCTPVCSGKTCGADGCGGSCGGCAAGRTCCGGTCRLPLHGICSGRGSDDCCPTLMCDATDAAGTMTVCCRQDGASCTVDADCCTTNCVDGTCTTCQGQPCDADRPCCVRYPCDHGFCGGCADSGAPCSDTRRCCAGSGECSQGYCGGCKRRQASDSPDTNPPCQSSGAGVPCCDTECTDGLCASALNGRCIVDQDCLTCVDDPDQCSGAEGCVSGTCTV